MSDSTAQGKPATPVPTDRPAGDGGLDASAYSDLAPEHVDELRVSCIPAAVAAEQGVYTAYDRASLPEWAQWIVDRNTEAVPALVYPMKHPDGVPTGQVKPALGSVSAGGRPVKYISPGKDHNPPKLVVVRDAANPEKVVIVEGTKQALAVRAWAPYDWSIYMITGIWAWSVAGDGQDVPSTPTPLLSVVQGYDVVIVPDADARSNVRVFDGAVALGEACESYGASSVKFMRLPAAGKDGIDDVLARLRDGSARRALLQKLADGASPRPADLDKRELNRLRKQNAARDAARRREAEMARDAGERARIEMTGDMHEDVQALLKVLVEAKGGMSLFQRNGQMVRVRRDSAGACFIENLSRSGLRRAVLEGVYLYSMGAEGPVPALLTDMMADLMLEYPELLPALAGITRTPPVLADGKVLTHSGYDAESKMLLDLSPDVEGLDVPEHPTDAEMAESVALIRDDLFAMDGAGGYDGWVFEKEVDQTHAIAALVTTVIRSSVSRAPMAIVDGIQAGSGKGQVVDVISRISYGEPAALQVAPGSDDEMRKQLVSDLFAGADGIVLDEVQSPDGKSRLESPTLTAVLTAEVYTGRKLGSTERLRLENRATVFGLGNNVQIPGDMIRRVYRCRLSSDRPDLATRDNFRYNLDTWVSENRPRLLRALLILVRAWYDRGQPEAPRSFGFASFQEWQRIVGGVLHLAGINGFASNILELRKTADSETVDNLECWEWIETHFSVGTRFAARDVLAQAKADPDAPAPYGKSWDDLDARALSMYFGQHPRWYSDIRIREDGKLHAGGKAYVIDRLPSGVTPMPTSTPATPVAPAAAPRSGAGVASGEVIEMADRNGFKVEVARRTPPMTGKTIAEMGGEAS